MNLANWQIVLWIRGGEGQGYKKEKQLGWRGAKVGGKHRQRERYRGRRENAYKSSSCFDSAAIKYLRASLPLAIM